MHEQGTARLDRHRTDHNLRTLLRKSSRNVEELVALAARHLGNIFHRKCEQSPVFAIGIDDRDTHETLLGRHERGWQGQRILGRIKHSLARLAIGDEIFEARREAVARIGGDQPQPLGVAHHHAGKLGTVRRIETT